MSISRAVTGRGGGVAARRAEGTSRCESLGVAAAPLGRGGVEARFLAEEVFWVRSENQGRRGASPSQPWLACVLTHTFKGLPKLTCARQGFSIC